MADYTVGGGGPSPVEYPEFVFIQRIKGIVVAQVRRIVVTEGLGVAPPVSSSNPTSGAGIGSVISRGSPAGVAKDIFFHGSSLNTGGERPARDISDDRVRVGYPPGGQRPAAPQVQMLPMWAADP